jgi:hypothetical protein
METQNSRGPVHEIILLADSLRAVGCDQFAAGALLSFVVAVTWNPRLAEGEERGELQNLALAMIAALAGTSLFHPSLAQWAREVHTGQFRWCTELLMDCCISHS